MRYLLPFIVATAFILGSCAERNYIYRPVSVKPTFFTTKGDFNAQYNIATTQEVNAAYAFAPNFFVSGGLSFGDLKSDTSFETRNNMNISREIANKRAVEFMIGGGYFKELDTKIVIENKLSFAYSQDYNKIRSADLVNNTSSAKNFWTSRYYRIIYQPAIGRVTRFFDYGFVPRFTYIVYPQYKDSDWLFEPTLYSRMGYKHIKFMMQMGLVVPFRYNSEEYHYFEFPVRMSIGLHYTINQSTRGGEADTNR